MIKRAQTAEAAAAAALCYIAIADAPDLDPDGDLTAALWPFEVDDYAPAHTPVGNLRLAQQYLSMAIALAEDEEME